jgi:hypothetical protein
MRVFMPVELGAYQNILAYLRRVQAMPGYQRTIKMEDHSQRRSAH